MDQLQLPSPTMIYRFPYGNHVGVAAFMWKIPDINAIDQTQVAWLVSKLNEKQQFFATRDMRKDFIDRYSQHVSVPKSVLRNINFTEAWQILLLLVSLKERWTNELKKH